MKLFNMFLLTFAILCTNSVADNNNTYSYIDNIHKIVSENILDTSRYIDGTISSWVGDDSLNKEENTQSSMLNKEVNTVDSFYKNERFMDDTDNSFIRIRASSKIQSIGDEESKLNIKARLSLHKTKKHIKLFIEEEDVNENEESSKINVGLSYLTPKYYNIDSKYSVGISGFYPYISARYKTTYENYGWLIEPVQLFKYIIKDQRFEEKTNIYFDTKLDKLRLFRVKLSRGTKSDDDGMDYGVALIYYYLTGKKASLNVSQSFSGNTKYEYEDNNDQTISYHGINTYSTNLSWRHSVWKKWFFYEIKPGVDFSRVNNYKANYKVVLLTDFYFGYY
ncbi:MAG: hypothetical protein K8R44_02500 [Sulfurimonas sp.]|nr:hypothetical protein [Sulfurimonas sp.]